MMTKSSNQRIPQKSLVSGDSSVFGSQSQRKSYSSTRRWYSQLPLQKRKKRSRNPEFQIYQVFFPMQQNKLETAHIHSYVRSHITDNGKRMIWKCADPLCSWSTSIPKRDRSMLKGKMSLCPECTETKFLMTSEHLKRKRPICDNCKSGKDTYEKGKNLMETLFGGNGENI
jgi:hypothetical protein